MVERAVLPKHLKWRPDYQWGGVFEKWARGWVERNFWRVQHHFLDKEDALQECASTFVYCLNHYKGPPDQPKLMMAYFKMAVSRDWHTYATKATRIRELPIPEEAERVDFSHGPLAAALANASSDLKDFLRTVENAPADFLKLILTDELSPARIKHLCGIKGSAATMLEELKTLLA